MSFIIVEPAEDQSDRPCADLLKDAARGNLQFLSPAAIARILRLEVFEAQDRSRLVCQLPDGSIGGFVDWESEWITHLFVAQRVHGCGVGRALFNAAQYAMGTTVRLLSFKQNRPALAFYLRIGCTIIGEQEGTFFGSREHNFLLERTLPVG